MIGADTLAALRAAEGIAPAIAGSLLGPLP
jgi:hypothetical protein